MTTHESCYDAEAEGKARMGKSVREQVTEVHQLVLGACERIVVESAARKHLGSAMAHRNEMHERAACVLGEHHELFAAAEETAAALAASQADVARLRGEVFSWHELVLLRSCVNSFVLSLKRALDGPSTGDPLDVRLDEHLEEMQSLKEKVSAMEVANRALQPQTTGGEE